MSLLSPNVGRGFGIFTSPPRERTEPAGDIELRPVIAASATDAIAVTRDGNGRSQFGAGNTGESSAPRGQSARKITPRGALALIACACTGGGALGFAAIAAVRPFVPRQRVAHDMLTQPAYAAHLPPGQRRYSADGAFAGDAAAMSAIETAHRFLDASPSMRALRASLRSGSSPVYISLAKNQAFERSFEGGSEIVWDPQAALMQHPLTANASAGDDCMLRAPILALPHEETHADWKMHNPLGQEFLRGLYHPFCDNLEEARAIAATNVISRELGIRERRSHTVAFKPVNDMFDDGGGKCPAGALPAIDDRLAAAYRAKANPGLEQMHDFSNEEQVLYANVLTQGIRLDHGLRREIAQRFNENRLLLLDIADHIASGGSIDAFEERLQTHTGDCIATAGRLAGIGKPVFQPDFHPHLVR